MNNNEPPLPNVLMVDDVEANLLSLEATLANLPCKLLRARSGNEALRLLLTTEFAVMLLDVQMPEMDGYEVAHYVHSHPKTYGLPIIFLTATSHTEENILRGYTIGAVDYLFKPINAHILRGKVNVFVELYNNRQHLAREIDSHKKTLVELERANAALKHFTHAASHDLKEPLRAGAGFLKAFREEIHVHDKLELGKNAQFYMDQTFLACERMSSLLDALLIYARLQKPSVMGDVDCNTTVAQVLTDLDERIKTTHATINVQPLPHVQGDSSRIYQLFLNLVSNAIKFRKPDAPPQISITVDLQTTPPQFCVTDQGIGFDPEYTETIFKAFERLHSRDKYEGSGLGLTICQQIVQQHGGCIWVESQTDQGSRFYFVLAAP